MDSAWKSILQDSGASFGDEGALQGFDEAGSPDPDKGSVLFALTHTGLICVAGEDAQSFLQGQLTNDVRQVGPQHSQLSAYCSTKGRALALGRLFMRADGAYYLRLPAEIVEPTLKRLRMFVLRAQVTIEPCASDLVSVGYAGPQAAAELTEVLGAVPDLPDAVRHTGHISILRLPGPVPRFELIGPVEEMEPTWTRLRAQAAMGGPALWRLLDVRAGVPMVYPATVDAFVPQMMNLQLIGGVSFRKGCYAGQEVVARMQYLGKLKRRMYRARLSGAAPQPGDEVYAAGEAQSAGKVVDAQPAPEGHVELLAVLQIASAGAELHVGAPDGPRLELLPLPYALPEEP
ncbi:folate-binding protein YgfZ [Ectothiorhodospiraceae bacterium 2226]|nr:folate-binding protein YgfZ [Ectothiorhodospiraceae bacterium 2226]